MPLYKCEVTSDIVVDAENKKEAIKIADKNIHEELSNTGEKPINITTKQLISIRDLPHGWDESIPWNEKNHNKTCLNILISKQFKSLRCYKCQTTEDLVTVANKIACKKCVIEDICNKKER